MQSDTTLKSTLNSSKSIAVIGAGPAGITAAYKLALKGHNVTVFEASDDVGGMARTIKLWDQKVDIGPHRFFSSDARVNRVWLEVIGRDYRMVDRLTRIFFDKKFFHYPLKPFNALIRLGILESIHCVFSYLLQKIKITPQKEKLSFEDWVVNRFGYRLFELFFKSYSEKLWGISCQELGADFAAQRIKKFSLGEAIKQAFSLVRSSHKTLVDRFAYPIDGSGEVYKRMANAVESNGGQVLLKAPVESLKRSGDKFTISGNNFAKQEFDQVISTMPLTTMVRALEEAPHPVLQAVDQLRFRNTILVYLLIDGHDLFGDQWVYIHSAGIKVGRITNFRNWTPELYGESHNSILALEYWCNHTDDFWKKSEQELIELAKHEIKQTGLLKEHHNVIDASIYRIPKCYPIYDVDYKEPLELVKQWLNDINGLHCIGRYGSFKYNNQDHSILMGLLVAENIAEDAKHDLWNINTDYDDYQEEALIDDTGLTYK